MKMKRSHGLARESMNYQNYIDKYPSISKQFLFVTDGYNFRNHEICAVLGSIQLKRLDKYIEKRNKNYIKFIDLISKYSDSFLRPKYYTSCSNFCFPLLCKVKTDVDKLKKKFDEVGIEYRPIISGNLLRQPFLKDYSITTNKKILNVDYIHENGFYLGNNQFLGTREISLLETAIKEILFS